MWRQLECFGLDGLTDGRVKRNRCNAMLELTCRLLDNLTSRVNFFLSGEENEKTVSKQKFLKIPKKQRTNSKFSLWCNLTTVEMALYK